MDVLEPVLMVRDAEFGANFTPKLVLALGAVALVAWDVAVRKRPDYVWVFATGTVIWTLVELSMQLRGTRIMPEHLLFGREIPLAASTLLQGMAEGAFVAVVGLFVADRVFDRRTRAQALLASALGLGCMWLLMAIQAARVPGPAVAASHREMTAAAALLFLLAIVGFDVWFWLRRPAFRRRSLAMAGVITAFATVWTVADVTTGGRWVEAGNSGTPAPPLLSVVALSFDVVVEIALAYVPFFAIPALLGLIRTPQPPPTRDGTAPRADDHRTAQRAPE